jgi:hypothetical protein
MGSDAEAYGLLEVSELVSGMSYIQVEVAGLSRASIPNRR